MLPRRPFSLSELGKLLRTPVESTVYEAHEELPRNPITFIEKLSLWARLRIPSLAKFDAYPPVDNQGVAIELGVVETGQIRELSELFLCLEKLVEQGFLVKDSDDAYLFNDSNPANPKATQRVQANSRSLAFGLAMSLYLHPYGTPSHKFELYSLALQIVEKTTPETYEQAMLLNNLIRFDLWKRKHDLAIEHAEKSLRVLHEINFHDSILPLTVMRNLFLVLEEIDNHEAMLSCAEQEQDFVDKNRNNSALLSLPHGINKFAPKREKQHPNDELKHQLVIFSGKSVSYLPIDYGLTNVYDRISVCYFRLENFEKAVELGQLALADHLKIKSKVSTLSLLYSNLSVFYSRLGDDSKEREYAEEAIKCFETLYAKDLPEFAISYQNMAESYFMAENWEMTILYSNKEMSILKALAREEEIEWSEADRRAYFARKQLQRLGSRLV